MDIDTKSRAETISEVEDAPSIAPGEPSSASGTRHIPGPIGKPLGAGRVAHSGASARPGMSTLELARNCLGFAGLAVGVSLYLVFITGVLAFSICWLPFSRTEENSKQI